MKQTIYLLLILTTVLFLPARADAQLAPLDGTVKDRDGQGRIKAILQYKKGHLLRKRIFDESGQLLLDTVYRDGKPVMIKTYYPDGQLKSVWSQKKGESQYYYPTGARKAAVHTENSPQ